MRIRCKKCGRTSELNNTTMKYITCGDCGTKYKNPLYKEEITESFTSEKTMSDDVGSSVQHTTQVNQIPHFKFCINCGAKIHPNAVVCPSCGCECGEKHKEKKKYEKSRITAAILAFLLGGIGVHEFYMGHIAAGIFSILFCWTGIPGLVAFIKAIIFLCKSDEDFQDMIKKD